MNDLHFVSSPKRNSAVARDAEFEYAVLMLESPSGRDGNLLTKDVFDTLWEMNSRVLLLEVGLSYCTIAVPQSQALPTGDSSCVGRDHVSTIRGNLAASPGFG